MSRREFVFNEKKHQSGSTNRNSNNGFKQTNNFEKQRPSKKNKSKNEVLLKDGDYILNPSLTRAKGHIEIRKGLLRTTIKYYNADLHISVKGGRILKLSAYYLSKNGLVKIPQITPSHPSFNLSFPLANIPNNQLKVTVDCEIEIGRSFFKRITKHLKASCFLNV